MSPPRGVQLPTFCISHPPNTNFSSSSLQSFQSFSKSTLPSSLFQDLNFFLSISQLSAAAVLLSFDKKQAIKAFLLSCILSSLGLPIYKEHSS